LKAVIFDMDGVIVDSEPLHIRAEHQTFAGFGLKLEDEEFFEYMGRTPRILLQGIIDKYHLDTSADALYPVHMRNLKTLYQSGVLLMKGAMPLIEELSAAGIRLALASSSDQVLIDTVLDKFDLKSYFHVVVSGQHVARIKPHPDIFLMAARHLNLPPADCLVIEDSTNGIRAARAAGMACVGFRSPNSHNQTYDIADRVVDSLSELNVSVLNDIKYPA